MAEMICGHPRIGNWHCLTQTNHTHTPRHSMSKWLDTEQTATYIKKNISCHRM